MNPFPKPGPIQFIAVLLLGTPAGLASAQEPVGGEFQVNTFTTGDQRSPAMAITPSGSFVVVWSSGLDYKRRESADIRLIGLDTDGVGVQGQRYAADGSKIGGEFQVNTYTTSDQENAQVAMGPDGNFVVAWSSTGSSGTDTDESSIHGQLYDSGGLTIGLEFQVNSLTSGSQRSAAVAMEDNGDFVVVWSSRIFVPPASFVDTIRGQRYISDGTTLGSEFVINLNTTTYDASPSVAGDSDGGFVVVWSGGTNSTSTTNVQGRRYASDGSALGSQFVINTYTTDRQINPAVSVNGNGDFVVVWMSDPSVGTDFDGFSIRSQIFTADGMALGGDFQVNTYTTGRQANHSVTMDSAGNFVVAWDSAGSSGTDSDLRSIQTQIYAASGMPIGGQFQANSYTSSYQDRPSVAIDSDGDFVVVWGSDGSSGSDTNYRSVLGQRFRIAPVFIDGFETGDTTQWQ